ncbi:MAG TPA: hypothetical protein VNO81_11390, partial [Candidatus Nitrosotenuis sp.]|nr:hypothetical protein [Candidatus Nitrosotenuis sp.]
MELPTVGRGPAEESQEDLQEKARALRVPYVDLASLTVDPEVARILPLGTAERYNVVCIGKVERRLTLAMADPTDLPVLDAIAIQTRCDIEPVLA